MGRGERAQAYSAKDLLFGPRRERKLSDEEKEERRKHFLAEIESADQGLEQIVANLESACRTEMVGTSAIRYGGARISGLLRGDGQRLMIAAQQLDQALLDKASVERSQLDSIGASFYAIADEVDRIPRRLRRHSFGSRHRLLDINSSIQHSVAELIPITKRIKAVADQQIGANRGAAERDYLAITLGRAGVERMSQDLAQTRQLLTNHHQIDNIISQGDCFDRLSANFTALGEDEIASELDLAKMHIAVADRADYYASRALSALDNAPYQSVFN